MHWASQAMFEQSEALIIDAQTLLNERLKSLSKDQPADESVSGLFRPPPDSVMTTSKLTELQMKLCQLRSLINTDNRTAKTDSARRLARFVMLNPHSPGYSDQLEGMFGEMGKNDPLRDNVLLAEVKLLPDEMLRAERLAELHKQFANSDSGMQALYELALLKIHFWRQQDESKADIKKQYLSDARATLNNFLALYPNSFWAEQVKKNLESMPAAD
jgi:hypothetical protein